MDIGLISSVCAFLAGIALFLFGMTAMGDGLEKCAGGQLKKWLGKLTDNPIKGFILGAGVTAVIQSSSATTVMLVGFVNSGIMSLSSVIPVIMGANVGTTITAWILSLAGIDGGDSIFMTMLKPVNFSAILAIIGVILYVFLKSAKKKDIGFVLLGFTVLIYGMDIMSGAVSGLKDVPEFTSLFTAFENPVLGVLAGAAVTAIIQSSSASVGILQSLADSTRTITFSSALPIIMGQNIGTCVTALISSVGANKSAKRVAVVHLAFNIIGTVVLLSVYCILAALIPGLTDGIHSLLGTGVNGATEGIIGSNHIAIVHTVFNLICTAMLLPFGKALEKLSYFVIRESESKKDTHSLFDDRLLDTPIFAIDNARKATVDMAESARKSLLNAMSLFDKFDSSVAASVREDEDLGDRYEDEIGSYLLKISERDLSEDDGHQVTKLLHSINDMERLSDHAVNLLESAEEMKTKELRFSEDAKRELDVIINATKEILDLAVNCYVNNDYTLAAKVEPLEEVIDDLQRDIKLSHIARLKNNGCTVEMGFILNDVLTNLERVSDHCSNIAGCVIEIGHSSLDMHGYTRSLRRGNEEYDRYFDEYSAKYNLLLSTNV